MSTQEETLQQTRAHKTLPADRQVVWPVARGDGAFDSCDDPEVRAELGLPLWCGPVCNCKKAVK